MVPEAELEDAARDLARSIAEKSPTAVQMGKQAYYEMADMEYKRALEYSNQRFGVLCTTDDAAEGIDAFLAGRDPPW